jgi:hypothetical protein
MRGSVVFDECGFLSEEMLEVYGAFAAVDKDFATGKDRNGKAIDPVRLRTFATNIPNQKFYISSASSTDTKYYRLYREFAKTILFFEFFVSHLCMEAICRTIVFSTVVYTETFYHWFVAGVAYSEAFQQFAQIFPEVRVGFFGSQLIRRHVGHHFGQTYFFVEKFVNVIVGIFLFNHNSSNWFYFTSQK